MNKELTPKEQKFAELCVSLGNQTEAYRQAFKPTDVNGSWIRINASQLAKKVKEQIREYRSKGTITYKPQPKKLDGYVYILDIEGFNYYKVGLSRNVPSRKKAIQTLVPFDISIVRAIYVDNCKAIEQEIHERLKDYRFKGEWFECDLDLINNIFNEYDT
tara:strand:+ start:242 stop:721 length:480 start_codon:yes stop_codon:yes gene_type:complete